MRSPYFLPMLVIAERLLLNRSSTITIALKISAASGCGREVAEGRKLSARWVQAAHSKDEVEGTD